jgi:hypothetical protein
MPTREIEEFASALIREVRDAAVRDADLNLRPDARSATAKRWRDGGPNGPPPSVLVPDCVDEALYFLLNAIDQGTLRLKYVTNDGKEVDLGREGLGELAGWYIGPDGWRAKYSGERASDFAGTDGGT